ncbi:hypothetical protein GCM10022265_25340 [Marinobacter xestospongiae]
MLGHLGKVLAAFNRRLQFEAFVFAVDQDVACCRLCHVRFPIVANHWANRADLAPTGMLPRTGSTGKRFLVPRAR